MAAISPVSSFSERLRPYGCTEVICLDKPFRDPAQLDYLDLLPPRQGAIPLLNAVAEHQGTALLYLIDATGDAKTDGNSLAELQRQLANRSDPAWLGVVRPGSLDIYPIGFREEASTVGVVSIDATSSNAPFFFQSLVHGTFSKNKELRGSDYVFKKIFGLLKQTTDEFVPNKKLAPLDILSMAGRALFFRFLIDRGIVKPNECEEICQGETDLKKTFSTAKNAAQTSAWLDETFNGDFLQLIDETIPSDDRNAREQAYLVFYRRMERLAGKKLFTHLEAILRGWQAVGEMFQEELDWNDLDFRHIPVGVLSQVYESFSHRADAKVAKQTSVHYTPRSIAGLMVDQSFAALEDKAHAQVLDPSCGAGIFLVLSFRRLFRERWLHDEERPDTRVIQEILYKQLCGFDVSEPALRLAALALYITAIELNASPRPPKKLKFPKNLRGEVLHRFGGQSEANEPESAFVLGSLGTEVPEKFNKRFDIVIGNPPWTRLREDKEENYPVNRKSGKSVTDKINEEFTKIGRRVLESRNLRDLALNYENPDKNPDIPFLWRAIEWAKEGRVIAFAMPARLFGRTSGVGYRAWNAVLSGLQVTGLISGADLRKTAVWDGIDMPFCVLFSRNSTPPPDQHFIYASPTYDPASNGRARFRIDYEIAKPISVSRVQNQPWVLKTLSLGTWLDVEIMEVLINPKLKTLSDYWKESDPQKKKTGKGFVRFSEGPQKSADFIGKLKIFQPSHGNQFYFSFRSLKTYAETYGVNEKGQSEAYRPCRAELYQAPLVIIPQSPGENDEGPRGYISQESVAFSQSYYGYSCAGHPEGKTLAALIYLLAHSKLFAYFCLMTSRRSGFDRQTFNKEEFDALPFPDLAKIKASDKAAIQKIAHRLESDVNKPWNELNALLFRLYGLDDDARQVAEDTLFAAASYRKAGEAALHRTTPSTRVDFLAEMREGLNPYFDVCAEKIAIQEITSPSDAWENPWFFLALSREGDSVPDHSVLLSKAMEIANDQGSSRIIVQSPGHGLLLGLLNQQRWWTRTRARLCCQHIIREHLGAFGLTGNV